MFDYYTLQIIANNKGADQTARTRRVVSAFIVRMQHIYRAHLLMEEAIYSWLSIAKKRQNGYLQLTVNSQKTLKWLFTVDCQ